MDKSPSFIRNGPRINSSMSKDDVPSDAAAAVASTIMFDSKVNSLADFGCTHRRIRGRLYATREALLFYSNLLGFETRITVLMCDINSMELVRTTSIELRLCDGEVYTFSSFQNREHVLQVLVGIRPGVKRSAIMQQQPLRRQRSSPLRSQASDPTTLNAMRLTMPTSSSTPELNINDENDEDLLSVSSVTTPLRSNRQRASSETAADKRHLRLQPTSALFDSPDLQEPNESYDSTSADDELALDKSMLLDDHGPFQDEATIEREWKVALDAQLANAPLKICMIGVILHCNLQLFYNKFLADNAPHSIDQYQRDEIGDKNVVMSPWTKDDSGVLFRKMTSLHPITNSMGMGPSEARTTRIQKMQRFGNVGLIIEGTTRVEGVPAADAFSVCDLWLVEAMNDNEQVRLTTRFETRFHKRCLFKSFIEKSVLAQTTEWYSGYQKLLMRALTQQGETIDNKQQELEVLEPFKLSDRERVGSLEQRSLHRLFALVVCLGVAMVAMMWQLFSMAKTIGLLRSEISGLREEFLLFVQVMEKASYADLSHHAI
ncbi:hypothetical protein MPSEU_000105900 [Mayamaea pseudoterrestris]|nr:hypothetical protein MPSEU_000105900 [Mayamaea pseudoterrestris]